MKFHITQAAYTAMVQSFRDCPGNFSAAARAGGMYNSSEPGRKAWDIGWPRQGFRPIKDVITEEQQAARALALEAEASARAEVHAAAKRDLMAQAPKAAVDREAERVAAVRVRAEEGRAVQQARSNVLASVYASGKVLAAAVKMADKIPEEMDGVVLKTAEKLAFIDRAIKLAETTALMVKTVLEAERLKLGLPQAIIGLAHVQMPPEQALEKLEHARSILARAQMLGLVAAVKADGPAAAGRAMQDRVIDIPAEPVRAEAEPAPLTAREVRVVDAPVPAPTVLAHSIPVKRAG